MTASVYEPTWPRDPDHCEAIDTLLVMAEAEDRWGESRRALDFLESVEQIVGALPPAYEHMRWRCRENRSLHSLEFV